MKTIAHFHFQYLLSTPRMPTPDNPEIINTVVKNFPFIRCSESVFWEEMKKLAPTENDAILMGMSMYCPKMTLEEIE